MTDRLLLEMQRLYGPLSAAPKADTATVWVLEMPHIHFAGPAVGQAWQTLQNRLGLPAPALSLDGQDSHLLWLALPEPLPATALSAWQEKLGLLLYPNGESARLRWHTQAPTVGTQVAQTGLWSAFVQPELLGVFEGGALGMDFPANPEAQADLLARLRRPSASEWAKAADTLSGLPLAPVEPAPTTKPLAPCPNNPHFFLQQVMNNPSIDWTWRIQAAQALLPYHPPGHCGCVGPTPPANGDNSASA